MFSKDRVVTESAAQQRAIDMAKRGYSDINPPKEPTRKNASLISSVAWQAAAQYIRKSIMEQQDIAGDLIRSIVPEMLKATQLLEKQNIKAAIDIMRNIDSIQLDYVSTIRVIAAIKVVKHNLLCDMVEPRKVVRHVDEVLAIPKKMKSQNKKKSQYSDDETLLQKLLQSQFFPYTKDNSVRYIYYSVAPTEEQEEENKEESSNVVVSGGIANLASMVGLLSLSDVLRSRSKRIYNVKLDCFGFYGNDAVDGMRSGGLASTVTEAVRIGRALHSVGCIQNLKSGKKFDDDGRLFFGFCQPLRKNWRDLLFEYATFIMNKQVPSPHTYLMRVYDDTFTGIELITLMVKSGITSNREDAVYLGRAINAEFNVFRHFQNEYNFEDKHYLYTFNTLQIDSKGKLVEQYRNAAQESMVKAADVLR